MLVTRHRPRGAANQGSVGRLPDEARMIAVKNKEGAVMGARRSTHGFTIMEMLIATGIMMTVTGAVFTLMNPTQGTYKAQPEVSDMQQRMRVGADMLTKDLIMAGAGTYMGTSAGALYNYFSPIMPCRVGDLNPDPLRTCSIGPTPSA